MEISKLKYVRVGLCVVFSVIDVLIIYTFIVLWNRLIRRAHALHLHVYGEVHTPNVPNYIRTKTSCLAIYHIVTIRIFKNLKSYNVRI